MLEAAVTKWNFLKFAPGLVGGHCIGVDPYYLTLKAQSVGYDPQVILSDRQINDGMGAYVAQQTIKKLSLKKSLNERSKVLIMGVTFKENCSDIRNPRVEYIYNELQSFGLEVEVYDPLADVTEVEHEYGFRLVEDSDFDKYSAVILAVAHSVFKNLDWLKIRREVEVIFDVKSILPKDLCDSRL